jgi:hypothetical protein
VRRRRKGGTSGDSLELLLDTICNTFGGIVFIALLVVLTLRNSAPAVAEPEGGSSASAEELERSATRLQAVTAELVSLRMARADLARRSESFAPDEVRRLISERNTLAESADELRSDRDRRNAENATTAAELERREAELAAAIQRAAEAEADAARLETELAEVRAAKAQEIRNPLVRPPQTWRHVTAVVRYGRLYVWHRYGADGERLGLNTDEFVVVEEASGHVVTRPDPTKGIPLSPGASTSEAIRSRLKSFPPSRFTITIVLRGDSFERFAVLRNVLIETGYQYRLILGDSPVSDRGGSDSRVQ